MTLDVSCCYSTQQIAVDGTLTADDTTFTTNLAGTSDLVVNSGGHLQASNSTFNLSQLSLANGSILTSGDLVGDTFNMPIFVPYIDIPLLGNSSSFDDIDINAATISAGTLSLNVIGTNTSTLRYVFPASFTVAPGATLIFGPNVSTTSPQR